MILDTIVVGPLQVNCYIVGCEDTLAVFIVDPGDEPERILRHIKAHAYKPVGIINTHCHPDHVGAVKDIQDALGIPFYMHEAERPVLEFLPMQEQQFGLYFSGTPDRIETVCEGTELTAGKTTFSVLHTPGHSPGSICLLHEKMLLTGDTLFAGSIGRTDLPGGSFDQIMHSIQSKILCLPDPTSIFPGHGPPSSLARERRFNPFILKLTGEKNGF